MNELFRLELPGIRQGATFSFNEKEYNEYGNGQRVACAVQLSKYRKRPARDGRKGRNPNPELDERLNRHPNHDVRPNGEQRQTDCPTTDCQGRLHNIGLVLRITDLCSDFY